ncbi:hypothetical protein ACW9IK_19785 [Pseudomonas gingeri]
MLSSTYHDGKLGSIAVTDDTLILQVMTESKTAIIQLDGLEKLRASDFEEGNIINAVRVFEAHRSPTDEATYRSLIKQAYKIDDNSLMRNEKLSSFLEKKVKEYEQGALIILEVEPSYGCYLVAIGRTLSEVVTLV